MQPIIAAMAKVRGAFYAAFVRSLLKTKSILATILKFWISPAVIVGKVNRQGLDVKKDVSQREGDEADHVVQRFLRNVERELRGSVDLETLSRLSNGMKAQMETCLLGSEVCMLPSYNHQLPTGYETGTYLALDVGGSTFRVALIKLTRNADAKSDSEIVSIRSFKIDQAVKQLQGILFFDWLAERVEETLSRHFEGHDPDNMLSTGMAWSFPIEQTSLRSGRLQSMGKFFMAADGLLGEDLGDLVQDACSRRGLNVQLDAIVNDSAATLFTKAFVDDSTRFGLILGTGVNASVHLPVSALATKKYGVRPQAWHDVAHHVIVNTELSMYGGGLLPLSRWDADLNAHHSMPDFQPLEHFVSGGYLGEIARLILVEGIRTAGLLGGIVPASLERRYSLDSEVISRMEADNSLDLGEATKIWISRDQTMSTVSATDIQAIRTIASHVSHRAAAVLATAIHALWQVRNEAEGIEVVDSKQAVVAYNGSVMENYPGYQSTCQEYLNRLAARSGAQEPCILELEHAEESSLLGAAIAVACLDI